jgi:hypothetical protein
VVGATRGAKGVTKRSRQCIFCDNERDSKEHVWPQWITTRLRKHPAVIFGNVGKRHHQWGGPKPEFKAYCVCTDCNIGWMSELEASNIPLIGALMQDIAAPLNRKQQETIARWATKTAMVMECITTRRNSFYTRTECAQLRLSSQIPNRTFVWLGRYTGFYTIASFATDSWTDEPNNPQTIHAYVNTFVLGRLAMQILTFHVPDDYGGGPLTIHPATGVWERNLLNIWSTQQTVRWPPALSLSFGDDGPRPLTLDGLRNRWSLGKTLEPD